MIAVSKIAKVDLKQLYEDIVYPLAKKYGHALKVN